MFAPPPIEDGSKTRTETGVLPTLHRTAIDMGSKNEGLVTRCAYPETVEITDWGSQTQLCLWFGGVPQLQDGALRLEDSGVRPCASLRDRAIDLERLNVALRETF